MSVPLCDLALGLSISRTELGLADLDLNDGATYSVRLDGVVPGDQVWRRELVRSPFVEAKFLQHAVRDTETMSVTLVVQGATWADVDAAVETARTAFDQAAFTVAQQVDTETHQWVGSSADVSRLWRAIAQAQPAEVVTFTFPVHSVATS